LSIAWTGCLGEMIMVRRDLSSPLYSANPNVSGNFIHLSSYLAFSIRRQYSAIEKRVENVCVGMNIDNCI
jgi:hypothetical protein